MSAHPAGLRPKKVLSTRVLRAVPSSMVMAFRPSRPSTTATGLLSHTPPSPSAAADYSTQPPLSVCSAPTDPSTTHTAPCATLVREQQGTVEAPVEPPPRWIPHRQRAFVFGKVDDFIPLLPLFLSEAGGWKKYTQSHLSLSFLSFLTSLLSLSFLPFLVPALSLSLSLSCQRTH